MSIDHVRLPNFCLFALSLDRQQLCHYLNNVIAILIIQSIADLPHGDNWVWLSKLFSEGKNMTVHRAWVVNIHIPSAFEQFVAMYWLPVSLGEDIEQAKFLGRKIDRFISNIYTSADRIDAKIAIGNIGRHHT